MRHVLIYGFANNTMAMSVQAGTRVVAQAPSTVPPQRGLNLQVPLLKRLGAPRWVGAKSAPVAGSQLDPDAPGFVRPDCPPDAFETRQPSRTWRRVAAPSGSSPKSTDQENNVSFKSALEHASWLTSQEEEKRAQRPGKFGLGIFGL